MAKIKIVTDSTACLPAAYCAEHDIAVVQLSYTFEGQTVPEVRRRIGATFTAGLRFLRTFPRPRRRAFTAFWKPMNRRCTVMGMTACCAW